MILSLSRTFIRLLDPSPLERLQDHMFTTVGAGAREQFHEAGWHPSLFLSVSSCLVGDPYGGTWSLYEYELGVRKFAAEGAWD
ncbi:MAG: hypothetical protein DCO99_11320 [Synechococcus sp. XM-24]|nr:MAG: hypothetical protein DCO99_11320 [Synechococcus sp. XM-24]